MFSKALLQSAFWDPQRPSLDAAFSNYRLPAEIWDMILRLASGNNLARLVSYASVSRLFLDICVEMCVKSRVVSYVNSQDVINEDPEPLYQANGTLRLLANDPQGRIYFSCKDEDEQSLLIFDPEKTDESLEIKILDALKEAKLPKHEDEQNKLSWDNLCEFKDCAKIQECIVNTDGFVLILTYFVTYWRFNEQGLPYLCNYSQLAGSGSGGTTFYLCGTSDHHYFQLSCPGRWHNRYLSIDSKQLVKEHSFDKMNLKPRTLFWRTHELDPSTYASTYKDGILSFYSVTFEDSNPRYELITSTPEKKIETCPYKIFLEFGQYLFLYIDENIVVFCKNTKQLLCLTKEFTQLKSHFIVDDSLFLFGEKAGSFHFKVIYLPTKKDITERFTPYFSRLLSNKCIVWDLKLKRQDGKAFLNVIFENEESEPGNFYSLKIFNKETIDTQKLEESCPSDLAPQEELIEATPSVTETLSVPSGDTSSNQSGFQSPIPPSQEESITTHETEGKIIEAGVENPRPGINPPGIPMKTPEDREEPTITEKKPLHAVTHLKVSRSFCVPHKLMMFAGIILSFGTAIGTVTLMVFHPGMVIYQGSGVILTLPTVLTLGVGGSVALIILAIGSVRWYQAHKRSGF